jgi:signal transduction histidine kinase
MDELIPMPDYRAQYLGIDSQTAVKGAEFYRWLVEIERRAILPLKWSLLFSSIFVWVYTRGPMLPDVDVFVVFFLYACTIIANHYFFTFSKIPLQQVRGFCYFSYAMDLAFVTALIYLDSRHQLTSDVGSTDFYILYFLMIMRGLVLYRTAIDSLIVNLLISLLFVLSFWLRERSIAFFYERQFLLKIALVWMVILLSWFLFEIINRQKFELLKARERLYQTQQLTALGEMAAGIAHEINNPIGIISTYAEYLIRKADASDPSQEDYEVIRNEAQRCKRIVSELLHFARPSESRREPVDPRAVNDEVLRFIFHDRDSGTIKVEKHYPSAPPWVLVDPVQIKQALLNIYVNAQQALGVEGGQIDISLTQLSRDAVELVVADTGPGVAAQDLPRLFDPFFTRKAGGSGLGLAITRRLLEANEATIEILPRKPKGLVVKITFHAVVTSPTAMIASAAAE